ncbi:MAG: hypothetical protein Kow0022_17250 [Phycisphaerales bacterium]
MRPLLILPPIGSVRERLEEALLDLPVGGGLSSRLAYHARTRRMPVQSPIRGPWLSL